MAAISCINRRAEWFVAAFGRAGPLRFLLHVRSETNAY